MAKILITGGSGLLGQAISKLLIELGHSPVWLSRERGHYQNITKFKWDVHKKFIDPGVFNDVDYVVHLAGAGVMDQAWTKNYKTEIIDSRVQSAQFLIEKIKENKIQLKGFIGGSATGYYGTENTDELIYEDHAPGNDFLSKVCVEWEKSYDALAELKIKTTIIRTGIVLSKYGGAYAQLAKPAKLGFAAAAGTGKQFMPWIHIDDLAGMFTHLIFNTQTSGPYNAVATETPTNKEFTKALAESFKKKLMLPNIPAFALKLALGERAVALTTGLKVSNQKVIKSGYKFKYPMLKDALQNLAKTNSK